MYLVILSSSVLKLVASSFKYIGISIVRMLNVCFIVLIDFKY